MELTAVDVVDLARATEYDEKPLTLQRNVAGGALALSIVDAPVTDCFYGISEW